MSAPTGDGEAEVLIAPAKLTLSLRVIGLRRDGYHLIESEMVSLDLCDRLEVAAGDGVVFEGPGELPDPRDNLVSRALKMSGRKVAVLVRKSIPAGAGLGGGSSDAAAILRWAGFRDLGRAALLGADVPFCLLGGRARVSGAGERVEPLEFEPRTFTLSIPPLTCPTAEVYAAWDELGGPAGSGGNDLEEAALKVEPALRKIRDHLADSTGMRPRLAGSGSSWFVEGAFPGKGFIVAKTIPADCLEPA